VRNVGRTKFKWIRIDPVSVNSVEGTIFQCDLDSSALPVIPSNDQRLSLHPGPIRIIRINSEFPNKPVAVEELRVSINCLVDRFLEDLALGTISNLALMLCFRGTTLSLMRYFLKLSECGRGLTHLIQAGSGLN
jgi:hypothetical protein